MSERITNAYKFPEFAEVFLKWRDKIAHSLHIPLLPPIIEVAKVDILTSAGTGSFHFPGNKVPKEPISALTKITRLLKPEIQNLAAAVTSDTETPIGQPIRSGQLEMVAEIMHDRIEAEKNNQNKTWNPRKSPESLSRIDLETLSNVVNLYIKDRAFWKKNLAGFDPGQKPIKQSTRPQLNIDLAR